MVYDQFNRLHGEIFMKQQAIQAMSSLTIVSNNRDHVEVCAEDTDGTRTNLCTTIGLLKQRKIFL